MPVAGLRGRGDRVDYIIVKRDGVIDSDMDLPLFQLESAALTATPTPVRRDAMPTDITKRRDDNDNDNDNDNDDDDKDHRPPPPILITMTRAIPQAQATGGQSPTETVVVALPPPPPPPPPPRHDNKDGISQTTEHLLIAAGSIGATIIVVMILLGIYHIKKRGLTIAEAMKRTRYTVSRRGPTPPPKRSEWDGTTYNEYNDRKESITPPPAIARSGSSSSRMPLMATPQRNDSFNNQAISPQRAVSPQNTSGQSFLIDSPVSPQNSHTRNASNAPSSPVLPLQNSRESATTRNTRSMSDEEPLQFPGPPPEQRSVSPLPPPPTFRQFLFNRKSVSARPGFGPMVSRFSWTNSNAPQTPHDPYRDTNSHTLQRDSFMTQRSSIPRFRTVDSWVNQQTNRIEEQKLKEQFRFTQSSIATDDDVPDVPEIPKDLAPDDKKRSPLNNVTNAASTTTQSQTQSTPPSPPAVSGLPGKNIKHERHDTTTTQDTAPIFRQHPGNEVRFSQRSLVPSEILNSKMRTSVL